MIEGVLNELGPNFMASLLNYVEIGVLRHLKNAGLVPPGTTVGELSTNPTYAAIRAQYGWRWLRPDDQILGGTELTYSASYSSSSTAQTVLAAASTTRIPNDQSAMFLGWYCELNLGTTGYLKFDLNNQKKTEIPAHMVYDMIVPPHIIIPMQSTIFIKSNDLVQWKLLNYTGATVTGVVWPIVAVIGTVSQLGLN